jgi:hypothetical protein
VISIITNTIYEDPSMSPWHQPKYEAANREIGIDWPRTAHCVTFAIFFKRRSTRGSPAMSLKPAFGVAAAVS